MIGILGGTFDPIHYGHLRMAEELADALRLSQVRFIPSASPPHKSAPVTSALHRCQMVQLAIAGNARFALDDRELKRTGASYSIDTLLSLREELGESVVLGLIMGSDVFAEFDRWHRWQEILGVCHLVLVGRPNAGPAENLRPALQTLLQECLAKDPAQLVSSASGRIILQHITALDISATAIRQDLSHRRSARYLLPDAVTDYIHRHQLYA